LDQAVKNIDRRFYDCAKKQGIIEETSIVVEWLGNNPLEPNDPKYAPVGPYTALTSLSSEDFVRRGATS
jgi:hypothetical protein